MVIGRCYTSHLSRRSNRRVKVQDEMLPLSGAGKIVKRELRNPYWEGKTRALQRRPSWPISATFWPVKAIGSGTARLLKFKSFDDRRLSDEPDQSGKGRATMGYYVSQAILQGRKQDAGSIPRVSAPEGRAHGP